MNTRTLSTKIKIITVCFIIVFQSFGQTDKEREIDSLISLSEMCKQTNPGESQRYAERALDQSRELNDKEKIAACINQIAGIYYIMADYQKSLEFYTKNLENYKELNSNEGTAKTTNNLGVINLTLGNLSESFINFQTAYNLYIKLNNPEGKASCLNNMGLIAQKREEYKKSLDYFYKSFKIKNKLNNPYSFKQTLFNIGTSYYYLSKFDSSEYFLKECYAIEQQIDDQYGISITLNSLGMLELIKGNTDNANDLFNESLEIGRRLGDKEALIQNWNNIGIINLVNNNYNKAIEYFDSSLDLAIKLNLTDKIQTNYKNLSTVLEKQEKYKEALESYRLYTMLATQVMDEQKRVLNIENNYKLLEAEKEKQKQKTYLVILSAVIVIVVISAIFVIKQRQLKHESLLERTLAEQEKIRYKAVIEASEQERKRIAGDLHDSISYMLSTAKLNMSGLEDIIKNQQNIDKSLLKNSLNLIDEACNEVRNISHNLMPGSLTKLGLIAAVKDLVRKTNSGSHIKIKFDYSKINKRLDENIEISLYRIIQESINNIIKHANATRADISIFHNNNELLVQITDNGKGFNPNVLSNNLGIGWKNIYSRVEMINGKVDIDTKLGRGTSITIAIPYYLL